MKHNRKKNKPLRNGSTTVEFALVAPIIFMLFLGCIELTRINFLRHTAANAAYEAARFAIVPGGNSATGQAEAMRLLSSVGADQNVTVNVISLDNSVQATVTIPVNDNSWGLGRFTSNLNLVQSCTLRRETTQ